VQADTTDLPQPRPGRGMHVDKNLGKGRRTPIDAGHGHYLPWDSIWKRAAPSAPATRCTRTLMTGLEAAGIEA
jgi:hypothetical protein